MRIDGPTVSIGGSTIITGFPIASIDGSVSTISRGCSGHHRTTRATDRAALFTIGTPIGDGVAIIARLAIATVGVAIPTVVGQTCHHLTRVCGAEITGG